MWSASRSGASSARIFFGSLLAALSCALPAQAVLQPTPGGNPIPVLDASVTNCSDKNVEVCLDQSEGDPALIDARADALVAPEVFQPSCALTFQPITKGGGDHVAFGWYNLKPDPETPGKFLKPAQSELFGMFVMAFGNRSGMQLAGQQAQLDLAQEQAAGRYAGGEIGFFLAASGSLAQLKLDPVTHALTGMTLDRIFYTQHALNPGSSGASTFYQVLTWQSVKLKNAFYFGWEDRQASADADNDFDDLVFLVNGIQCSGGGEPCDTKLKGVCQDGTQQCVKGELTCVQNVQPSAEACNALDDDCDGDVDEGEDLCTDGKVCDRGRCVPKCGTGEFRCSLGLVCNERKVCVEAACASKDCPAGQLCQGGDCIDACKGVTCPYGELCRNGGCVDLCANVTCDEGYSCVAGVCRSCACSACDGGQVCGKDNVCVDSGCENQTCMVGTHCALGACVDDCAGTQCPTGQLCSMGDCVADPNASAQGGSGTGGAGEDGGNVVVDPGSAASTNGGSRGADGAGASGADLGSGQQLSSGDGADGCGCSVPGRAAGSGLLGALLLGGGLLARRRRR